jgi:hypothetical protein
MKVNGFQAIKKGSGKVSKEETTPTGTRGFVKMVTLSLVLIKLSGLSPLPA